MPAPPSSRRRSDRLNVIRQQIESILGITQDGEKGKIERATSELQIDKLEKILSDDKDGPGGFWTIAGSKFFEPGGLLPGSVVKRLGRNAGSTRAPSVSYNTSYEVGETSVCHHWRKRTLSCSTYEALVYNFRFLDAHIDKQVRCVYSCQFQVPIKRLTFSFVAPKYKWQVNMSASTMAHRKANFSNSLASLAIQCCHTDPATGFNEYFLMSQGKKRGSWYPEESVDLYSLIQYRFQRRK